MANWNDDPDRINLDFATRGRLGGLTTSSRHDPQVYGAKARERSHGLARFLEQIRADVPEPERTRRAEALRQKQYVEMGRRSGLARRGGKK